MGKGEIISGGTDGQYQVKIVFDKTNYESKVAALNQRISEIEIAINQLQKEIEELITNPEPDVDPEPEKEIEELEEEVEDEKKIITKTKPKDAKEDKYEEAYDIVEKEPIIDPIPDFELEDDIGIPDDPYHEEEREDLPPSGENDGKISGIVTG